MRGRRVAIATMGLAGLVVAACASEDTADEPPSETRSTDEPPSETPSTDEPRSDTPSTDEQDSVQVSEVSAQLPPVATFTMDDGLATDQVSLVDVGTDGTVWVATEGDPVHGDGWPYFESYARFDGATFVDVGSPDLHALDGLGDPGDDGPGVYGMDMSGGPDGTLWLAGTGWDSIGDAYLFDGTDWSSPIDGAPFEYVRGRAAPDGSLWMISMRNVTNQDDEVEGIELARVDSNGARTMPAPEGGIPCGFCAEYDFDGDGLLWMSTPSGLSSFDGEVWTPTDAGLPDVVDLGLAPNERMWVLGVDGRHWFLGNNGSYGADAYVIMSVDGDHVVTRPIALTDPVVDTSCIAEVRGLDAEDVTADIVDQWDSFSHSFQDFAGSADGDVWLALECSGIYRIDVETGEDVRYGLEDGLPTLHLRDLAAHPDGSVWVATDEGVVRIAPTS